LTGIEALRTIWEGKVGVGIEGTFLESQNYEFILISTAQKVSNNGKLSF
jgi:hypothetical protein